MQSEFTNEASSGRFAIDTTFVLFFLAVDVGQTALNLSVDTVLSVMTLVMLLVLPYFLPSDSDKPDFLNWLLGRSVIALFAIALGMMIKPSLGVILPETFRFLPMTLLVFTAIASCYFQFYAMIRLRLAR